MRWTAIATALAVVLASCGGSGPAAPPPGDPRHVCDERLCLVHPSDWEAEEGLRYLGFSHPSGEAEATASIVNMEAIATAAGLTWPVHTEEVAVAIWQLLDESDAGELSTIRLRHGGAVETFGTHQDGRMWHLLVPVDGRTAIGVELRARNGSWETHAAVLFSEVTTAGG